MSSAGKLACGSETGDVHLALGRLSSHGLSHPAAPSATKQTWEKGIWPTCGRCANTATRSMSALGKVGFARRTTAPGVRFTLRLLTIGWTAMMRLHVARLRGRRVETDYRLTCP